MDNETGESYLYLEETPGELSHFVCEFTNQEELRIFAKGRLKENPDRIAKGFRMRPFKDPLEIML